MSTRCACRNENTKGAERQLKFLVYCLEAACRAADKAGDQDRDQCMTSTACTLPLHALLGLIEGATLPVLVLPLLMLPCPVLPLPEQP